MDAFRPVRLPRFEFDILHDTSSSMTSSMQTGTHSLAPSCKDDPSWRKGSDTCAHYAIEGYNCEDIGDNGIVAKDACNISCNTCPQDIDLSHSAQGHVYDRLPSSIKPMDESNTTHGAEWKMGDIDPMVRAPEHNEANMELMVKIDTLTQRIQGFEKVLDLSSDLVRRGTRIDGSESAPTPTTPTAPTPTPTTPTTPSTPTPTPTPSTPTPTAPSTPTTDVTNNVKKFNVSYTATKSDETGDELDDAGYESLVDDINTIISDPTTSTTSTTGTTGAQLLDGIKSNIVESIPGITKEQIQIIDVTKGSLNFTFTVPDTVSDENVRTWNDSSDKNISHTIDGNSYLFTPTVDIDSIQTVVGDPLSPKSPGDKPMLILQDNEGKMAGIYVIISLLAIMASYISGETRIWKFKGIMFAILPGLYMLMMYFQTTPDDIRTKIIWIFVMIITIVIYFVMRTIKLESQIFSEYYRSAHAIKIVGVTTMSTLFLSYGPAFLGLFGA